MSKIKGKSFRKEALQATLKKRKECSTKALEMVEKLIEKNVTKEILLYSLHHINQSSYEDVIDERSIMNICGYPICCNELRNIPKHQYKITRTNGTLQLYDTTERKKFCSNFCYKAAKFLKDQLPSCPLWLIEPKEIGYFKLMPLDCKIGGSLGEQINFALKSISEMDQFQHISYSSEANAMKNDIFSDKNKDNVRNVLLNNCDKILCDKIDDNESEAFGDTISADLKLAINDQEQDSCVKWNATGASAVVGENQLTCDINCALNDNGNKNVTKFESLLVNKEVVEYDKDIIGNDDNHDMAGNESSVHRVESCNKKEMASEVRCSYDNDNAYSADCKEKAYKVTHVIDGTSLLKLNTNKLLEEIKIDENKKIKKVKIKKSKVTTDISPMLAAVLRTEQCIREWVSLDTLYFLLGEDKLRNLIEETCGLDKFQGRPQSSMQDPVIYERYLDICKKLNILELSESKFDRCVNSECGVNIVVPKKPVPDFEKLKKETKEMEIKVKSFYRGDKQVQFNEINVNDDKVSKETISIPLVDQHAQRALRRRIILDNLSRVLNDLLRALGLSNHSITITSDIKRLVETFTLSAHNITFRPAEWNFVAIIVIKLLSVRDEELHSTLQMERADKYLTLMLMSYEQDSGYLNRLLTWLLYEHTLLNV